MSGVRLRRPPARATLALMAVVTLTLGSQLLDSAFTAVLFVIAAAVLLRFNPDSAWLVLAGALAGLGHAALT